MVEWKKLGEVCEVLDSQRKPVSKGKRSQGEYPYYGANGIQDYVDGYIFDGTYLLLGEDGSVINTDNSPVLHWATGKIWVNNHAHILQENNKALLRYLYYTLQCTDVSDIVRGMPPKINQANLRNILIPIPSLSEQTRIVGILDTFTSAIDNLKEQIAQRRKQYEYYRDQLLDLEGKPGVEMKTLGEMTKVLRGKRLTKNMLDEEAPYPVFHGGIEPLGFYSQYNREANTVMIINVGASAGTVGYCDRKFWSSDGCFCISQSDSINNKFLYYYLETKTHYLQSQVRHAGIPTLDNPVVEKIYVPLLTLSEQKRIVSILDTFEASIQNLEAQLKERQKQYEYYRNKLLTFE